MATRSTIAIERADGTVSQVYCHWDGYLTHNGEILLEYWSDPAKLEQLIGLGNLSTLGTEIGRKHDFEDSSDLECCTFYGRDRGETGQEARTFADWQDYVNNRQQEEFDYVLRCGGLDVLNPVWEVCEPQFVPLADVLTQLHNQFELAD